MNFIGMAVKNKKFGEGKITGIDNGHVKVSFKTGDKEFQFPMAFETYLVIEDGAAKKEIAKLIKAKKKEEEKIKKEKAIEEARIREEQAKPKPKASVSRSGVRKKDSSGGIVFKCNYSDGGCGEAQSGIGYCGVCSDENVKYNIDVKKRTYCCSDASPCKQRYKDNARSEAEIKALYDKGQVCYESRLLVDWKMGAGVNHKQGPMKGKVRAFSGVESDSLCIFTTLMPDSKKEEERLIFGVGIVKEIYAGDSSISEEGYLVADPKYRISLSLEEAQKLMFWKYYKNSTNPDIPRWGTGLYRYLTKMNSAQILKAVADIKKGTEDAALAKEMLKEFCKRNDIIEAEITPPSGALSL